VGLYEELIAALPELENSTELKRGAIELRNDSDGTGDYIAKWDYSKPIPASLKTYDRT
jgi:hypothetical protein